MELTEQKHVKIDPKEIARVSRLPYKIPKTLAYILNGFKWAIHSKNQSAVVIVDGRSGMGKTTISFQMAKYMSESFCLDHVHFRPEDFLEGLTKVKKGDTIIFDEAMLLSSRSALTQINKMIVVAMSMIRSKNIFVIFNVNSIFDLDRNLALSRADILLNCYGDSLTDKGRFMAFFKGGDGKDRIKDLYINGKKYYSYARPKANFTSTFSSNFVLDEEEYEKKKQKHINEFLKKAERGVAVKTRYSLWKYILYLDEKKKILGITQADIGAIGGIARETVARICAKEKQKEKPKQILPEPPQIPVN